jgi:hypothetical protein
MPTTHSSLSARSRASARVRTFWQKEIMKRIAILLIFLPILLFVVDGKFETQFYSHYVAMGVSKSSDVLEIHRYWDIWKILLWITVSIVGVMVYTVSLVRGRKEKK